MFHGIFGCCESIPTAAYKALITKAMISSLYQEYEIHAKGQRSHMPKMCFSY
jgi:hypothetical protein